MGIVSGCDERFLAVAGKIPALPMAQVLGGIEAGRGGIEIGYAGLVATLAPSFRF